MTGLSIKTLAEALCEVAGNWGRFSNDMDTEEGLKDFRHERDFAFKLRRALCAKSERYEALERVAEAGRLDYEGLRFVREERKAQVDRMRYAVEQCQERRIEQANHYHDGIPHAPNGWLKAAMEVYKERQVEAEESLARVDALLAALAALGAKP